MPFMIRTTDGLISIGTSSAEEAARHVVRLRADGHMVIVKGRDGERIQVDHLIRLANAHEVDPMVTPQPKA